MRFGRDNLAKENLVLHRLSLSFDSLRSHTALDRLENPARARYHKVPTRHTRHEFPVQRSSLWWRRFNGALTLTGQSFCSVPCLSCASGSQLCGGILWVDSLLPVRRVCLLPVLPLPGPQKRSCNSVLCSSNTPP